MEKGQLLDVILETLDSLNKLLEKAEALGYEWDASSAYTTPKKIKLNLKAPVIKDNVLVG